MHNNKVKKTKTKTKNKNKTKKTKKKNPTQTEYKDLNDSLNYSSSLEVMNGFLTELGVDVVGT
jgi:predicted nucleotide-binding protein (sugar kinase/HSP70/actin superfamily)